MKRIYIAPSVNVRILQGEKHLMNNMSFSSESVDNSGDIGFTHEDAGWDIWQGDDFDEND